MPAGAVVKRDSHKIRDFQRRAWRSADPEGGGFPRNGMAVEWPNEGTEFGCVSGTCFDKTFLKKFWMNRNCCESELGLKYVNNYKYKLIHRLTIII